MTAGRGLARRSLLVSAAALVAGRVDAAEDGHHSFTIGQTVFTVPDAYLFGEIMPPGVSANGLPPHFSFAFTMPDGAPAGSGLEFPPITKPFELERDGGRYLVMCYRLAAGGRGGLNPSPPDALTRNLTSTALFNYSNVDGMLDISAGKDAESIGRYLSLISKRDRLGLTAFVHRIGDGQFFYGSAELERPNVCTVMYIPQERIIELPDCLNQFAELAANWAKK